jgi:hypothetical protein
VAVLAQTVVAVVVVLIVQALAAQGIRVKTAAQREHLLPLRAAVAVKQLLAVVRQGVFLVTAVLA